MFSGSTLIFKEGCGRIILEFRLTHLYFYEKQTSRKQARREEGEKIRIFFHFLCICKQYMNDRETNEQPNECKANERPNTTRLKKRMLERADRRLPSKQSKRVQAPTTTSPRTTSIKRLLYIDSRNLARI